MPIWSAEIKELEKLYESLKGQLPDLEKELERLIKADDENMVLLYSRRCLEVIITNLCECELKRPRKTEPLLGIIDKLHKEEKVPSHIIASMHGLNELSTYGAHPKDFDTKQVRTTLINLETVIEWYLKYKGIDTTRDEEKIQLRGEKLKELRKEEQKEILGKPVKLTKQKILSGTLITTILVIAAILVYPKIFKKDTLEKLRSSGERISLAVMPFQNLTNDTTWNVWQNGIQDILVSYLSNSPEELKVRQTESINNLIRSNSLTNYGSITPSMASMISQKLDADVFIFGSIKQAGSTIRLNAQLTDSKTEEAFKSFEIDGPANEEMVFQIIDSLKRMVNNYLVISKLKKELPLSYRFAYSTNSPEAFRYFMYGNRSFVNRDYPTARNWYMQAISADSNLTIAAVYLSASYANQDLYEEGKNWCLQLYKKRELMPLHFKIMINQLYASYFETPNEEIKYLKQSLEIDDQQPFTNWFLGRKYNELLQFDKGIPEFEKALEIHNKWDSKPTWVYNYTMLGYAYHKTGQFKKEKKLYKKAEQDFPDDPVLIYRQAVLSLVEGDEKEAKDYIDKYISIRKENSASEAAIATSLAGIYSEAGILDKAEEYYRHALLLEPENPVRMNNLAYFLIDKDRNLNEGMELIEKALQLSPDTWTLLDTKGWGLFKQGNNQVALEFLEKSDSLKPRYNHALFLHLEAAKKAVASQKRTDR